jgi:DNA primase
MNSPVQQIKERLGIEEVISTYIKLEKSGNNLKAKCPFHNEKTPSFYVSPGRDSYYCFGCGASGDIFSFVEEFEGLDFKGALKMLATRAGVELVRQNKEEESEKEKLYKAHEEATIFFQSKITPEVEDYLLKRGLNRESIQSFRIGFAPNDWRQLYEHLTKRGYSEAILEKGGLIKKSDQANAGEKQRYYDRFRGRIMFPISDSSGRVIAFSGRIWEDDGKSAKYLNSTETPIFSKSATLYGLDRAKESIRKNNFAILVEGQMDLVLAHQTGYRNTVATSGTALSDTEVSKENVVTNLGLIRRMTENIVLAFDGDKAGLSACERAGKIALSLGMDVKVASMPEGEDPADLISKQGADAWKEAVKNSRHIIDYLLTKVLKNNSDTRKAGRVINEKILPYIASIDSAIEQGHFIKLVSEKAGISESAIREDLKNITKDLKLGIGKAKENSAIPSELYRKDYIIRKLLGIIFWQRTLSKQAVDIDQLEKDLKEVTKKNLHEIDERWEKSDLIFEAEVFYSEDSDLEKDIQELLINLKQELLREELSGLMQKLYEEGNKDSGGLLIRIKEINEEMDKIKNNRK